MKIAYIAPRYHLNQVPIMDGWLKNGVEVCFISQGTNASEDHRALQPIVLGYSGCFHFFWKIIKLFCPSIRKDVDKAFAFRSKKGFPPIFKLKRILKDFGPDLAVLRERSLYTIVSYAVCKKIGIPCILYNQSPLFDRKEGKKKKNAFKKFIRLLCPPIRMTPIKQDQEPFCNEEEKAYYVPFVMPIHTTAGKKEHFSEGFINIICVAGYHERKQIPLILKAVHELRKKHPIRLVVAGEVITADQEKYYEEMAALCKKLQMEDITELKRNVSRKEVFALYLNADLFVLPSTRERASISQLEAMSCAIPVVCSNTNGSACQIRSGVNGYCFADLDMNDLICTIDKAVSSREHLVEMGNNSLEIVQKEYSFEQYRECIKRIMKDMI